MSEINCVNVNVNPLNPNRHKLSVKNKQCFKKCPIEMPMFGKWHLMYLYSPVKLNVKIIVLFWNFWWSRNWAHSHNFRDIENLVDDCGAKEISLHLLTAPKVQNTFHHCMSQSALKLLLIIWSNRYWKIFVVFYIFFLYGWDKWCNINRATCNIRNIFKKSIYFRAFHRSNPHK